MSTFNGGAGTVANTNYDVWAYYDSATDTVKLDLTAWSTNTARATALDISTHGVAIKSGDAARRYLGTIRCSAANTTQDTITQRFVWNYYNRQRKHLIYRDTTASWTYNSTTKRQTRGQSTALVGFVCGLAGEWFDARMIFTSTGAAQGVVGIGLGNITPVRDASLYDSTGITNLPSSAYSGYATLGYNEIWPLEWVVSATAMTFYSNVTDSIRSGLLVITEG